MNIRICGNSHTAALYDGAKLSDDPLKSAIFSFGGTMWERVDFSAQREDEVFFVEKEHAANFVEAKDFLFTKDMLWGLVTGTHCARLYADKFWSESAPSAFATAGQMPVSDSLLDRLIEADQANVRLFLRRMHATSTPCFVISCPPPRRDHPIIRYGAKKEAILYIDHRSRRLFREFLAPLGIGFVEPPVESFDADGFLKTELELRISKGTKIDYLHANDTYGALMLPLIHAYLDKQGVAVPKVVPSL